MSHTLFHQDSDPELPQAEIHSTAGITKSNVNTAKQLYPELRGTTDTEDSAFATADKAASDSIDIGREEGEFSPHVVIQIVYVLEAIVRACSHCVGCWSGFLHRRCAPFVLVHTHCRVVYLTVVNPN